MKNNNKKKGQATVFIYPEGKNFIGVCLELGIIEEHKNIDILRHNMKEAVEGHVEAVLKNNLDEKLLNRPAPKKYWNKFVVHLKREVNHAKTRKLVPSPYCSEVISLPTSLIASCI